MKYSVFTKFIAIFLCAASLLVCMACIGCIILCEAQELYTEDPEIWIEDEIRGFGQQIADASLSIFCADYLGHCPQEVLDYLQTSFYYSTGYEESGYAVAISQSGKALLTPDTVPENARALTYEVLAYYPTVWEDAGADVQQSDEIWLEDIWVVDEQTGNVEAVTLLYRQASPFDVTVFLQPEQVEGFHISVIRLLYANRYHFIIFLGLSLLVFLAALVYLCCAAARRPGSPEIRPAGLNRLPLDLHLFLSVSICGVIAAVMSEWSYFWAYEANWGMLSLMAALAFAISLVIVAFLFACAAQMKVPGGFWWRRTVTGFFAVRLWRCMKWMGRGIRAVCNMLPLVWQWVGAAILMAALPVAFLFFNNVAWDDFWMLVWAFLFLCTLAGDLFLIGWWVWYMGQIVRGAAVMGRGNLDHQIPTRYMFGKFRDFANTLNSMADAARIAAQRQLKSERMKTELITNVSHDIKTPLTSIINYVDLLKKPHDEEQEAQYLEVLDRQSQQLKKLIGDLMDMSKASTGNMAVEIDRVDLAEAVNQALGEFSDKLTAAGLESLFRCPRESVMIQADGRHLWRVLSNLLGNAVKYAMPGTRLYLDLMTAQGNAVLSLKNISRDQLNVDAEELLERFVRGDASRNTEGSGLGLNIAKSLVELQKGQMHLTVDGDLFKVTIVLPLSDQ